MQARIEPRIKLEVKKSESILNLANLSAHNLSIEKFRRPLTYRLKKNEYGYELVVDDKLKNVVNRPIQQPGTSTYIFVITEENNIPTLRIGSGSHCLIVAQNKNKVDPEYVQSRLKDISSNTEASKKDKKELINTLKKEIMEIVKPHKKVFLAGTIEFKDNQIVEITDQAGAYYLRLDSKSKEEKEKILTDFKEYLKIIFLQVGLPFEKLNLQAENSQENKEVKDTAYEKNKKEIKTPSNFYGNLFTLFCVAGVAYTTYRAIETLQMNFPYNK